jgi:hypothetical protein
MVDSLLGPIPRGIYTLKKHKNSKSWIRLIPGQKNQMFGRIGFAIHGKGNIGSHGCILPDNPKVIRQMINAFEENRTPKYALKVISIGPNIGWQNSLA